MSYCNNDEFMTEIFGVCYFLSILHVYAILCKKYKRFIMKITILSLLIMLTTLFFIGCATNTTGYGTHVKRETTLHNAVQKEDITQVKQLIKKGANVNARANGYEKFTPLHLASSPYECLGSPCTISPGLKKNQVKIITLLIKHGADVNAKSTSGNTSLNDAAICNAVNTAQLLIDSGADLNHRGNQYTALEIASSRGPDVAILLIKKGAKVNTFDPYTKTSPLHTAAMCGHRKLVKVLLEHGADVYVKDKFGKTPLDKAKDPIIIDLIKRYR